MEGSLLRYLLSVRGDHIQFATLDDVHLSTDISLPAHVVAGGEHLQSQLEDQLGEKALLAFLKYPHFLQGLQVDVHCYLRSYTNFSSKWDK